MNLNSKLGTLTGASEPTECRHAAVFDGQKSQPRETVDFAGYFFHPAASEGCDNSKTWLFNNILIDRRYICKQVAGQIEAARGKAKVSINVTSYIVYFFVP